MRGNGIVDRYDDDWRGASNLRNYRKIQPGNTGETNEYGATTPIGALVVADGPGTASIAYGYQPLRAETCNLFGWPIGPRLCRERNRKRNCLTPSAGPECASRRERASKRKWGSRIIQVELTIGLHIARQRKQWTQIGNGTHQATGGQKVTDPKKPDEINLELNREYSAFFHTIEQFGVLKAFQNDLYLLTGLPFDFLDLRLRHSEKLRAQRKFTPFCRMINNAPLGCEACGQDEKLAVAACVEKQKCIARRCHLGLIDVYVPIAMNGKIAGLFCSGQLHYRQPTEKDFQKIQGQLSGMGINLAQARQAYFSAPVIERRRVAAIIDLIKMVVGLIDAGKLQALKTSISHEPLRKALDYIEAHYAEPLTLAIAAQEAGLSASRLAHVFKAQVKMSFTAYLNLIRVSWAKYYLTNSSLRIGEAAFQVGFGNLSHFNHVFRQLTGIPPSRYRQQASTSI